MKKQLLTSMILIVIISLYGCSTNEDETSASQQKEQESAVTSKPKESNSVTPVQKAPSDQENLKIGDTGVIESTLGTAEITVKGIRKEEEVKGTGSQLSHFLIADVEVKNIGEKDIKAKDWVNLLEMVWDMEGDGSENQSDYYEIQAIDADLAPGESAKGEAIYDTEDTDEYYLMIDRGLLSGGSVYNNVKWSFKKSDL